jgi:hypothetical protein
MHVGKRASTDVGSIQSGTKMLTVTGHNVRHGGMNRHKGTPDGDAS